MPETATLALTLSALPAIGAALAGGIFAGITTQKDGTHCAVVLLDERPSKRLDWDGATSWAEGLGAQLPSRAVSALLFANLRDKFEPALHWTNEVHKADGACAWLQDFSLGFQSYYHKSYEGRARAVRRFGLVHEPGAGISRLPPHQAQQRQRARLRNTP